MLESRYIFFTNNLILILLAQGLQGPERDGYITLLSELYSTYHVYPTNPPISEHEVWTLNSAPSGQGGFASCWEGLFLGKHLVAMKTLHDYIILRDEVRAKKVCRFAWPTICDCSTYHKYPDMICCR